MDYKPASFRLGLIVSAVSFLIFLALLCAELIIRKKKRAAGIVS
jgi:multisubunit Na+/H+ antiporter MnhE subunit